MFFLFEAFFRRPTESNTLVWFRGTIATLFTIGFLSYAIYLGVQVHNDIPLVQSLEKNLTNGVLVPAIEICSDGSDVVIPRCDFQYNNESITQNVNCTPWLQPERNNTSGSYCYLFSVSDDIFFGTNDTNLITINFYFKILNLTAAIADTISIPSIGINVFDNPLNSSDAWTNADWEEWRDIHSGKASTAAILGFSTEVYFTRSSYHAIRSEDTGSVIGLTPNYDIVPRVEITMIDYPLHISSNFSDNGLSGHFAIIPSRFTEAVQREQRGHTVLSGLAFAGGAWGGLFGVYTILFGHQRLAPWGVMHRILFSNRNVIFRRGSFGDNLLPLVSSSEMDVAPHANEQQRAERVESRVLELESLLRDYFLDSAYLARLKSLQNSERRWSVLVV